MEITSVTGAGPEPSIRGTDSASTRKMAENLQAKPAMLGEQGMIKGWDAVVRAIENNSTMEIEFDREIGRTIIRIVDGWSRQTIAQFPPEELITFMKRFRQYVTMSVEGV